MYEIAEIMSIDVNNVWNCENNWTFRHLQGVLTVLKASLNSSKIVEKLKKKLAQFSKHQTSR